MGRHLAELLGVPEALAELAVTKLEHLSGWQSADVRLLAEINNKVRFKTAELGLDPGDTTGAELYYALKAKQAEHENQLGLSTAQLVEQLSKAHKHHKVYALKRSVAKDLLQAQPPRHLMKQLNYRSVDSMLKRENIAALYAALPFAESSRWMNVFWKNLSKVSPSDFEAQQIEIIGIDAKRFKNIKSNDAVTAVEILGAVALWPSSLSSLNLAVQIEHAIGHSRAVCAYIKLKQVESNFGKNLVEILRGGSKDPLKIAHMPVSWRTIFQHYGKRTAAEHTEYFGPHLLHEDIKAHHPIKLLAKVSPVFKWWDGLEYAIKQADDGLVSLNLADVLAGHPHNYKRRSVTNAQGSLWHEFIDRYLDHPSVEQHFMGQLELEPQTVSLADYLPTKAEEDEIRQLMETMA
jgi:hypothetical protein